MFACVIALALTEALTGEIDCESKRDFSWPNVGSGQTCMLTSKNVTIDNPDVTIKPDNAIKALHLGGNRNVTFAPVKLALSFPDLLGYSLNSCSIKSVSKIHFENLRKLKSLYLGSNPIEIIYSNTFEDLVSLTHLHVSKFSLRQLLYCFT